MTESMWNFSSDPDTDIEALMTRIRERIATRSSPVLLGQTADTAAAGSDAGQISHALAVQADFNQSIMAAFHTIAHELQALRARATGMEQRLDHEFLSVAAMHDRLREEAERLSGGLRALSGQVEVITARTHTWEENLRCQLDEMQRSIQGRFDLDNELRQALHDMQQQMESRLAMTETAVQREQERLDQMDSRSNEQATQRAALADEMLRRVDALADQMAMQQENWGGALDEVRRQLECLNADAAALATRSSAELEGLRIRLLRLERKDRDPDHLTGPEDTGASPDRARSNPIAADATRDASFDYFMFEHHFRGSTAEIKQRQQKYVPLFLGRNPVVDLGCGRGEFVELLSEHGVSVTGVDLNEDMVSFCQDRGLQVIFADLFDYLEQLPDASLDGIACLQVVEHLPPEQLPRFLALCGAKLRSAARIVLETPNPTCPVAMGNFFLDPSHVRPIPAELLRYLLGRGPFTVESIEFSAPINDGDPPTIEVTNELPPEVMRYQDYAAVARRR